MKQPNQNQITFNFILSQNFISFAVPSAKVCSNLGSLARSTLLPWPPLPSPSRSTGRSSMDRLRQEKIFKFEEFVDQRLKPDLVRAIAERDKVFEQQKIFSDLRRNIENLEKNSVTSLKTLVNIGSEAYLQAEVPDTQHIFVDIGLGFHVEFTWSEALNYITLREERIKRQLEEYTQLIASIKAQIKLVYEGIRELLQLPAEKPLPERTF
ncbi:hypothetical protein K1719_032591 [Acacia pycnantha]|nr:hypothetical protein K1719_032591 [Acacia pycnantha]